ncbi:MAG TPA: SDR family NAD(P)-dependent oxidoreductase [Nitrospinaceae bacterium]|mgnify:CR=1 FL=1|jgi:NAD(P)-dependent dehydrogenase (short-subunit alcohol dehydrogenase family)|nr:short-chain dehydrogenase [Nitrospinota bacterium]MDP6336523.1 SDR family NAD(P)-dependent oxidoreductase [Nitrospinaceae bacterium]MDP7148963.1 SDR family NAD(P)-dependent oxidoreductase [Nitrospinaceae bacterium]HJO56738.1 SDR family NAD(P)-dependent oxidoreductase [Nitrospinaceae bacterium]|tara:strand:+ start:2371 stop:3135 length:765 start_codon:yes stop_codon:yes gene_type:complete
MSTTKTVLVTGAGSGIGRAIAQRLSRNDYSLILLGRNLDKLETTKKTLERSEEHLLISCDIRQAQEISKALQKSKIESLYALIANAGVGGENNYSSNDRWREIIDINLTGTYNTIHESLPYLKKSGAPYKKIVILSSILARLGVPGYSAYCASKAGLLGLTRSLAVELAQDKILVNALCPGWVDTAMAHEGLQSFSEALKISKEEAFQLAMKDVLLGRMSQPDEIAEFTAFLISDAQTSITGQTLDINNGAMMP